MKNINDIVALNMPIIKTTLVFCAILIILRPILPASESLLITLGAVFLIVVLKTNPTGKKAQECFEYLLIFLFAFAVGYSVVQYFSLHGNFSVKIGLAILGFSPPIILILLFLAVHEFFCKKFN